MYAFRKRVKLYQGVKSDITEHLIHSRNLSKEYFPTNNNLLRNPFIGLLQMDESSISAYEQFIDIMSDSVLKEISNYLSFTFLGQLI
jgi:hypothetical protein